MCTFKQDSTQTGSKARIILNLWNGERILGKTLDMNKAITYLEELSFAFNRGENISLELEESGLIVQRNNSIKSIQLQNLGNWID